MHLLEIHCSLSELSAGSHKPLRSRLKLLFLYIFCELTAGYYMLCRVVLCYDAGDVLASV